MFYGTGGASWREGSLIQNLLLSLAPPGNIALSNNQMFAAWALRYQSFELRNLATGQLLQTFEGYRNDLGDSRIDPLKAEHAEDRANNLISPKIDFRTSSNFKSSVSLAFSPDDRFLVSARAALAPSKNPLKLWDVKSGKLLFDFPAQGKNVNPQDHSSVLKFRSFGETYP